MLPDPSVIGLDEHPHEAAIGIVTHWEHGALKIGETLGRAEPEDIDELRERTIAAVTKLIYLDRATHRHVGARR